MEQVVAAVPPSYLKLWGRFIPGQEDMGRANVGSGESIIRTNKRGREEEQQRNAKHDDNDNDDDDDDYVMQHDDDSEDDDRLPKPLIPRKRRIIHDNNNNNSNTANTITRYVRAVPCTLGRMQSIRHHDNTSDDDEFVDLGSSLTISRSHAVITFNDNTGFFFIQAIGSNVVKVRGKQIVEPVALSHGDAIRIGNVCVYVLFPEFDRPKKSYADLCAEVLEDVGYGKSLTSRKIAQRLIRKFPYINAQWGNAQKIGIYAKACQNAMAHSDRIVSVPVTEKMKRVRVEYALGEKKVMKKEHLSPIVLKRRPPSTTTTTMLPMQEKLSLDNDDDDTQHTDDAFL